MNWYLGVLQNYAGFDGRARRKEFWMFVLVNIIVSVVLSVVDNALGLKMGASGILGSIYSLAIFIPSIAVQARRLHDTGRSGWWQLIVFTIIGIPVLIYWYASDGEPGSNQYGPNPKRT